MTLDGEGKDDEQIVGFCLLTRGSIRPPTSLANHEQFLSPIDHHVLVNMF